ncbi:MAG: hypothetical protein Q9223_002179 [Gallowayella weberi]
MSSTASPTCTPTRPINDAVRNGGFECGLSPWVAEDIPNTTHRISSPGDASNFTYEFDQKGPKDDSADMHPAAVSQDIVLVSGVPYKLRFRTNFPKCNAREGLVGVMINYQPVYTIGSCDNGEESAGTFQDNLVQFFARADSTNVRFEFLTDVEDAVIKIDNVSVIPLH